MASSRWILDAGNYYYVTSSGEMAKDAYVKSIEKELYYWVNVDGSGSRSGIQRLQTWISIGWWYKKGRSVQARSKGEGAGSSPLLLSVTFW